jgi:hypothetical protein
VQTTTTSTTSPILHLLKPPRIEGNKLAETLCSEELLRKGNFKMEDVKIASSYHLFNAKQIFSASHIIRFCLFDETLYLKYISL